MSNNQYEQLSKQVNAGDKVKLTENIYDDGEDHHPPAWLAFAGEVLVVRDVKEKSLAVSHEDVTDSAFIIYENEYELL